MDAVGVIDEARQAGFVLSVDGGNLRVEGPTDRSDIIEHLRQSKPAIVRLIQSREPPDTSLLTGTPADLPDEWCAGTRRILTMDPPQGWNLQHWAGTQNLSRWLLRLWAERLAKAGWDTLSIYGVDPSSPYRRMSKSGLLFALPGGVIGDIYRNKAEIVMGTGERRTYTRKSPENLACVWELP